MALVRWTDDLSVNIQEIDRQHKELVTMINNLHNAMLQGKGKNALGQIINGLTGYIDDHFSTEEDYFNRFRYPDRRSHVSEHAEFTKKVHEFRQKVLADRQNVTIEMIDFLYDWLTNHILVRDKQYEQFLHDQGVR